MLKATGTEYWKRGAAKSTIDIISNDRIRNINEVTCTIFGDIEDNLLIRFEHVRKKTTNTDYAVEAVGKKPSGSAQKQLAESHR